MSRTTLFAFASILSTASAIADEPSVAAKSPSTQVTSPADLAKAKWDYMLPATNLQLKQIKNKQYQLTLSGLASNVLAMSEPPVEAIQFMAVKQFMSRWQNKLLFDYKPNITLISDSFMTEDNALSFHVNNMQYDASTGTLILDTNVLGDHFTFQEGKYKNIKIFLN